MPSLLSKWGLLAVLVAGGMGAWIALEVHPHPSPTVIEKIVQGKTETVVVEKVVEKTIKPDGTVTERVVEKAKTARTETQKSTPKTTFVPKTSYSLGLTYLPSISRTPSFRDIEITAGARLGLSGWWVTTGYDVKHNQITLGLRYEW